MTEKTTETEEKALNFNSHFLNQIVYHSIQSTDFIQKVRGIFPLSCFKTQERKFVMEMIYDHFDQFKTAPMDNFYDIFKDHESVMDSSLYEKCIILIDFLKDITGSNPEYILSKIEQAVMHLQLEEASIEFASLIKRKKYEEAKSVILKAMRPPEGITPDYFDYFKDKEYVKDRAMGESFKMKTMIDGLDRMIGGINPPWLVTLLGASKSGKCVKFDSPIMLSDGSIKTIEEVVKNKITNIITYNEDKGKLEKGEVSEFYDNGIKPCYRVITKTGREQETTLNHPYLTVDGWKSLFSIKIGQCIAVLKKIDFFSEEKNEKLNNIIDSDIFFDEVVSIEYIGDFQTYDIFVPETHNFVGNNVIIHNSWHLIEFAVAAVLQGLNVTYFSLEMNKKQMVGRFDQTIGFLSARDSKEQQEVMVNIGDKWGMSKQKVKSIYDIKSVERNKRAVRRTSQGGLKIIASNKGRFNYRDIERVLNQLEQEEGYITDVLVVDYLGIMKHTEEGQNKKQKISENCLGLVELCGTRNMICFTAMQGNRQAMRAKVFQSWMIADDIDTVFWSDLILAICQTKNEEKQNKARLHVANFRHGKQFGSVGLIRDLNIGQIALGEFELKEGEEEGEEAGETQTNNGGTEAW